MIVMIMTEGEIDEMVMMFNLFLLLLKILNIF